MALVLGGGSTAGGSRGSTVGRGRGSTVGRGSTAGGGCATCPIDQELKSIGLITKRGTDAHATEQINDSDDLAVTAGWGNPGRGGITMPAGGKVVVVQVAQPPSAVQDESRPGAAGPHTAGPHTAGPHTAGPHTAGPQPTRPLLGQTAFDIYLNGRVYWRNIPAAVWEYTLGVYQVIKKWLSYREHKMLGRSLRADEARYVTEMARRIAAILLMQEELDENYCAAKNDSRAGE